jgi:hypothetical protein
MKDRHEDDGPYFLACRVDDGNVLLLVVGEWQGFGPVDSLPAGSEPRAGYVPESAARFPVLCADVDVAKRDRD